MSGIETSGKQPDSYVPLDPKFYPLREGLMGVRSIDDAVKIVRRFRSANMVDIVPPEITSYIFAYVFPSSIAEAQEMLTTLKSEVGLLPEPKTIGRIIQRTAATSDDALAQAKTLAADWGLPVTNQQPILY